MQLQSLSWHTEVRKVRDLLLWDKNPRKMSAKERQDLHTSFTIMSYVDLWYNKRDSTNEYVHPTQKPVTLHEKPLKRCSSPGDVVLDLFGGSGSTLITCEQLKRKARLTENDPVFCDVIVRRWERLTGQEAVHHGKA